MSSQLSPFPEVVQPRADSANPTGPDRTLGRLAVAASWLNYRRDGAGPLTRPRWVLIAGDVTGPDSALPDDANAATELANALGIGMRVVDVASTDAPDTDDRIVAGQPSPVAADLLTHDDAVAAVDVGRRLADTEIDEGADLLIPGLAGSGHAVPLGVITAVLTGLEPVDALALADDDFPLWVAGVENLRDALFRIRDREKDAVDLLAAVGGADLAALTGLIAQAAARRTPVLLDGLPSLLAAVLAHRLAPGAEAWFLAAADASSRSGMRLQEMLGLTAVAALDTDSPAGAGALLVVPLLQAALTIAPPAPPEPLVIAADTPEPQPAPDDPALIAVSVAPVPASTDEAADEPVALTKPPRHAAAEAPEADPAEQVEQVEPHPVPIPTPIEPVADPAQPSSTAAPAQQPEPATPAAPFSGSSPATS